MAYTPIKGFIQARTSSCESEESLNKQSIGFKNDLHTVRRAVAFAGLPPEVGVNIMKEQGSVSENQELELIACLSRIAAGECVIYPPKA